MRICFFICFLFSSGLMANPDLAKPVNPEQAFVKGINAYQQGEYAKASGFFKAAAVSEPHNEVVFYNWGLAEMNLENWGWSVALLRKALALSPSFKEARRALKYVTEKLPNPIANYSPEGLGAFRSQFLTKVSWHLLLLSCLLLLLFSGLTLIKYFGRRKKAFAEEEPLPAFPVLGSLSSILFIVLLFCLGLKSLDLFESHATLVVEMAQLHTGPSTDDTILFEVFAGQDLILAQKHKDWLQVRIPGGVTGWLPANVLFLTSERRL
ncbi:MAG: hypothetical protein KDD40_12540, partial [Bdellovibrionales bacterium]|nr:hypothetical protein [Bdellovibrionales bacterium]